MGFTQKGRIPRVWAKPQMLTDTSGQVQATYFWLRHRGRLPHPLPNVGAQPASQMDCTAQCLTRLAFKRCAGTLPSQEGPCCAGERGGPGLVRTPALMSQAFPGAGL